jgi:hypothetical protein
MTNAKKEAIAKAPERRPRRTALGTRNILTVSGKEAGYHYRIVNDAGDRIQEFLDNGWEVVKREDVRIGDKRLGAPSSAEGSAATAAVGRGMTGYVLRIREDWYNEDQAAKQDAVNQQEAAITDDPLKEAGTYGKLEISRD